MDKYIKNLFCIPESISLKNNILFKKTTLVLDTFISNNHNFVRSFLSKHKNCLTTFYFYGNKIKIYLLYSLYVKLWRSIINIKIACFTSFSLIHFFYLLVYSNVPGSFDLNSARRRQCNAPSLYLVRVFQSHLTPKPC